MLIQDALVMPMWKLSFLVFFLQIDTLARAIWRRKDPGLIGLLQFTFRFTVWLALWLAGLFLYRSRAAIVMSIYAWARVVDDIADGDGPLPRSFISIKSYVQQKRGVAKSILGGDFGALAMGVEDLLLVHAVKQFTNCGIDLSSELEALWEVFEFDFARQQDRKFIAREKLILQAVKQDTYFWSVFVRLGDGDFARTQEIVGALQGLFTRSDWVYDFLGDLQKGFISIPLEVAEKNQLDPNILASCKTWAEAFKLPGVQEWYQEEIYELSRLWQEARTVFGDDLAGLLRGRFLLFEQALHSGCKQFERGFLLSRARL